MANQASRTLHDDTKGTFGSSFRKLLGKEKKKKPEKIGPKLPRPRISLPVLVQVSQPVYATVDDVLEKKQRMKEHPSFATLPRTGSTGSTNYTRLYLKRDGAGKRRPAPPPPVQPSRSLQSLTHNGKNSSRELGRSHSTAYIASSRPQKTRHSYEALSEWQVYQPLIQPSSTYI